MLTAELLISKGGKGADVNSFSDKVDKADMWKPLHLSALQNHTEMMEVLIRCGAEVNIPNVEKATPLHYAVEYGNLEVWITNTQIHSLADLCSCYFPFVQPDK